MYLNISDSSTANNKGSSGTLVHYLEKENRVLELENPERWFNQKHSDIEPYEARRTIDQNIAKLSKTDAKFFLINISPSQKEIAHLKACYGAEGAKTQLKAYAKKVMNEYAKNFNREGINSSKDLVWFAKLENHRYYSYKDKEVKEGTKKRGELKAGDQMHVQVMVSRKDASNKIKLSPMNNSRGKNVEHSKKLGQFDRMKFKQSGETCFDKFFDFDRKLSDTFAYAKIQKSGSFKQRMQLSTLVQGSAVNVDSKYLARELIQGVAEGRFLSTTTMLESVGKTAGDFMKILLAPVSQGVAIGGSSDGLSVKPKKKKKKKGQQQEQELEISR
ncbi:DUF5712 family protein [Pedobacter gandavensis]|uniref:DUF5712 family protein n=1 Tax=Pedobacter gandavensis TaxID=2679963 RepID=UPI00247A46A1|nr:DUF5712 family protein [Pedobacter gandavensis]WGQ11377.1 DUF5712 family protein [Pedobacter gandavensis]